MPTVMSARMFRQKLPGPIDGIDKHRHPVSKPQKIVEVEECVGLKHFMVRFHTHRTFIDE